MSKLKDQAIKELNKIKEKKEARVWIFLNCLVYLSLSVAAVILSIQIATL